MLWLCGIFWYSISLCLNHVEQTRLALVGASKCHQPPSLPVSPSLTIQISSGPRVSVNINKPIDCGARPISHWSSITHLPLTPLPSRGSHTLHPRALRATLAEYLHFIWRAFSPHTTLLYAAPLIFPFTSQSKFIIGDKGLPLSFPLKKKKPI